MSMLAIIPSSQPDYYPATGMTEAQAANNVALHFLAHLEGKADAAIYYGKNNSSSDATRRAMKDGCRDVVSIHFDAGVGAANKSMACYYGKQCRPFAQKMLDAWCAKMGTDSRGLQNRGAPDGIHPWPSVLSIPVEEYDVVNATLMELLTQDNAIDAAKIKDPVWQELAGYCMASAYLEAKGITPEQEEDEMVRNADSVGTEFHFADLWLEKYDYWLHVQLRGKGTAAVQVYATLPGADGGFKSLDVAEFRAIAPTAKTPNPYIKVDIGGMLRKLGLEECSLSVHSPSQPIVCALREF